MGSTGQKVLGGVKFVLWLVAAVPGAVAGWALAGWLAPLVWLPDALSYRLIGAGMLGILAGGMALGLVEDVSEKGPTRPGDRS